jgi:DNA polymerase-3 subunit gamma/tau
VPTEEGAFWHATVRHWWQAEAITALVRELALQSQLVARDTDQWVLRVERESLNQNRQPRAAGAALQAAGHAVSWRSRSGRVTDSPARRNAAAAESASWQAENASFSTTRSCRR